MTYYDNATAIAFKVGRWEDKRVLRNFELEALASERRSSARSITNESMTKRWLRYIRPSHKVLS